MSKAFKVSHIDGALVSDVLDYLSLITEHYHHQRYLNTQAQLIIIYSTQTTHTFNFFLFNVFSCVFVFRKNEILTFCRVSFLYKIKFRFLFLYYDNGGSMMGLIVG